MVVEREEESGVIYWLTGSDGRDRRDLVLVVLWCCNTTKTTFHLTAATLEISCMVVAGRSGLMNVSVCNYNVVGEERRVLAVSRYPAQVSSYRDPLAPPVEIITNTLTHLNIERELRQTYKCRQMG